MALFDQLGGLLSNVMGGNLSEQETHDHYDQIAQNVPSQQTLGQCDRASSGKFGFRCRLQQRVASSATQMSPDQRGGIVQSLLGGFGSSGMNMSVLCLASWALTRPSQAIPQSGLSGRRGQAGNPCAEPPIPGLLPRGNVGLFATSDARKGARNNGYRQDCQRVIARHALIIQVSVLRVIQ